MDRFVRLDKPDFIGREAAAEEAATGPRLRRVSLAIDARDADVTGDEPIWTSTQKTFDSLPPTHGIGAPRCDFQGRPLPRPEARRDGAWQVVGWVTSGGYGHHVKASLAQGYVPAALAERTEGGLFQVEILGQRRPARIITEPLFDPEGTRMRM
jgi:dimethylglycine dehydrogenase